MGRTVLADPMIVEAQAARTSSVAEAVSEAEMVSVALRDFADVARSRPQVQWSRHLTSMAIE